METTNRFPQELGNLAQNARFPHSHKPTIISGRQERKDKENGQALSNINWPQDRRILGCIQDRPE